MTNMGYCRFRNTLADLKDCRDYLDDETLSVKETEAREALIKVCKDIAEEFEGD